MASGRLVDYLGGGVIADRPASLTLVPDGIGLWWATDTDTLSVWDGSAWEDVTATPSNNVTIITEASTSTMDPATHAGRHRYIRAADDVTFDSTEGYAAGEVYNIRATAALTLIDTGVTLTPPAGGTLALDPDMAVSVIMTTSTAGDVIGQTVPV